MDHLIFNKHRCTQFFSKLSGYLLLMTILSITACGYQLQKPLAIDEQFQPVYVSGNSALSLALKRKLLQTGITLSDLKTGANSVMQFEQEKNTSHSFSVSQDGRNAELLKRHNALFSWVSKNTTLINPSTVRAETLQITIPDRPTAERSESELNIVELNNQLIEQVLTLIRYVAYP